MISRDIILILSKMICRDVWIFCIGPKLEVISLIQLSRVSKLFYSYFGSNDRMDKWREKYKKETLIHCFSIACCEGDKELAELFISKLGEKTDLTTKIFFASRGGHKSIVDFLISKGADHWEIGLFGASLEGHRDLVEFFISKGANNWNDGLRGACINASKLLVEFFISKGANNWDNALNYATSEEIKELIRNKRDEKK